MEVQTKSTWRLVFGIPRTHLGRAALVLVGLHVVSMLFFTALVDAGQTGGETFPDNLWLSGTILLACLFALAGGVASFIAVTVYGERSIINWAIILFGLFVLVFALGEIFVPR